MQVADARVAANRLISAYRQSQCVGAFADLGLAEHLSAGFFDAAALAAAARAHEPSLRRLLRALTAMQVVAVDGDGRYSLTPVGEHLRGDRLGPSARMFTSPTHWASWARLDHSVRTGERAFDLVHGMRNWHYYATHPEAGALFDAAMSANTGPIAKAVIAAYDFSPFGLVADIGGGEGTLLAEVLEAHAGTRGLLFDRPDVIARGRQLLAERGLSDRCETVGGSFFESVPRAADAYVVKSILHDWEDSDASIIVGRIREAAEPGAVLLVIDRVLPDTAGPEDLEALLMDLEMLVNTGGLERTESEFRALLAGSGFRLHRVVGTTTPNSVLEAVAV